MLFCVWHLLYNLLQKSELQATQTSLSFEYRVLYGERCVCLEKLVIPPFSSAYQGLQIPLSGFVASDA